METRDIVNAPEVKKTIVERSQRRKDDPEITQWFEKKFFEYVIKHFNPVFHVNSVAAWKICQLPQPIPAWFLKKLEQQPDSHMLYIDPLHEQILALEKPLLEFFNSRLKTNLKGKFMKMTYDQVLDAWHKDHEAMKKRLEKGQWDSSEHAISEVLAVDTGRFIEITATGMLLRKEMAFESRYMQHCLGQFANLTELKDGYGEHYVTQKEYGLFRYFSLRDASNKPHVTISLEWDGEAWCIEQIKGKQNQVPVKKYVDDVLLFLNHIQPKNNHNSDCSNLGIIYRPELLDSQQIDDSVEQQKNSLLHIEQLPYFYFYELSDPLVVEGIVMQNPDLMDLCTQQSSVLQWMMLATNKEEYIKNPQNILIQQVMQFNQTDFDQRKLNIPLKFEKKKTLPLILHLILLPFYLIFLVLGMLSQIPWIGWIFKILMFVFAIPAMPFLKSNADQRKKWALATGDLIYVRNKISCDDVDTLMLDDFKNHEAKFRTHLDQLLKLEQNSQIERLQKIEFFLKEYFYVGDLYGWYDLNQEVRPYYRDVLVYAHIQKIIMMRLLHQFEYVGEDEAWQYILASAQIIQECCTSWQEMGQYYAQGREIDLIVRHSDYNNYDKSARHEIQQYLEKRSCNWKSLDWNLTLLPELADLKIHPIMFDSARTSPDYSMRASS
ncbi:DUF1266 domain-containing protein [Acinetobacter bereziniae]|uniref:DUF1266 domain-containing protein n=1 Tax=Acinetobacter bereziniae TaxID=106648 RepID=UPI003AF775E8